MPGVEKPYYEPGKICKLAKVMNGMPDELTAIKSYNKSIQTFDKYTENKEPIQYVIEPSEQEEERE